MITYKEVENLVNFKSGEYIVTSFYINVDGSKYTKKECEIATKSMVKAKRKEIGEKHLSYEISRSVEDDLSKVETLIQDLRRNGCKGIAVFSCSALDFWQVYNLPLPVENLLYLGSKPYLRPLVLFLGEHKRYCVVLVDRMRARLFELYMGEVVERSEVFDEVPGKVKETGWYGLEEKRIRRHIDYHIQKHLKRTADIVHDSSRHTRCECLILGGPTDVVYGFEKELGAPLREKIVARINVDTSTPEDEIRKQVLKIEAEMEEKEEKGTISRLTEEITRNGLGVYGLDETLKALKRGQVHTLIVTKGYGSAGLLCKECGMLATEGEECPICETLFEEVPDVVESAIEEAIHQGCRIRHISPDLLGEQLESFGNIGALLRFKID